MSDSSNEGENDAPPCDSTSNDWVEVDALSPSEEDDARRSAARAQGARKVRLSDFRALTHGVPSPRELPSCEGDLCVTLVEPHGLAVTSVSLGCPALLRAGRGVREPEVFREWEWHLRCAAPSDGRGGDTHARRPAAVDGSLQLGLSVLWSKEEARAGAVPRGARAVHWINASGAGPWLREFADGAAPTTDDDGTAVAGVGRPPRPYEDVAAELFGDQWAPRRSAGPRDGAGDSFFPPGAPLFGGNAIDISRHALATVCDVVCWDGRDGIGRCDLCANVTSGAPLAAARRVLCVVSRVRPDVRYCPLLPDLVLALLVCMPEQWAYLCVVALFARRVDSKRTRGTHDGGPPPARPARPPPSSGGGVVAEARRPSSSSDPEQRQREATSGNGGGTGEDDPDAPSDPRRRERAASSSSGGDALGRGLIESDASAAIGAHGHTPVGREEWGSIVAGCSKALRTHCSRAARRFDATSLGCDGVSAEMLSRMMCGYLPRGVLEVGLDCYWVEGFKVIVRLVIGAVRHHEKAVAGIEAHVDGLPFLNRLGAVLSAEDGRGDAILDAAFAFHISRDRSFPRGEEALRARAQPPMADGGPDPRIPLLGPPSILRDTLGAAAMQSVWERLPPRVAALDPSEVIFDTRVSGTSLRTFLSAAVPPRKGSALCLCVALAADRTTGAAVKKNRTTHVAGFITTDAIKVGGSGSGGPDTVVFAAPVASRPDEDRGGPRRSGPAVVYRFRGGTRSRPIIASTTHGLCVGPAASAAITISDGMDTFSSQPCPEFGSGSLLEGESSSEARILHAQIIAIELL